MATATRKKKQPVKKAMPSGKGLTFEKVWALMQESAERSEREFEREKRERIEQFKQHEQEMKQKEEQLEKERKQKEEQLEKERKQKEEQLEKERKQKEEQLEKERKQKEEQLEKERKQKEEQYEREKKESDEKYRREKNEADKELMEIKRIVRRNSKQMGELHQRFGQLAEHLVAPGIAKRFNELGYNFSAMAPKGQKIFDAKTGKMKTEIDLILENGKTIMAVEVKTRPVIQDVEHHIKRLEILRDHRRGVNDQRKVQGAVAGAIYEDSVKEAVREAGMYVIEQSGDTMKIDMPDGFIPREW